jgi:hypothetical protein
MERFNALSRGAQIMLVAGVLFLISTFFNWQSVDLGVTDVGQSAWHGFWGVVMGLLTIVLIAWLVARLAGVDIPIPVSAALIGIVLAVLIFLCALIKALTDDFVSSWAWIGVVLAALIVVGAALEVQAAGGIDALRSEATSFGSSRSGAATASTTTTTTAPPPPAPPVETAPPSQTAPEPPPPEARDVPDTGRASDEPPRERES